MFLVHLIKLQTTPILITEPRYYSAIESYGHLPNIPTNTGTTHYAYPGGMDPESSLPVRESNPALSRWTSWSNPFGLAHTHTNSTT